VPSPPPGEEACLAPILAFPRRSSGQVCKRRCSLKGRRFSRQQRPNLVSTWRGYRDAENVLTILSMVAGPVYRSLASGFGCIDNKMPGSLGIVLFLVFFTAFGPANTTLLTAISRWWGCLLPPACCPRSTTTSRYAAAHDGAPSSSAPPTLFVDGETSCVSPVRPQKDGLAHFS
jgi:hypothetical protein